MKIKTRLKKFAAMAAVAATAATAVAAPVAFTGTQTVMADDVVKMSKNSIEMKNGSFDMLIARVEDSRLLDKILYWDSSDPSVVKVTGGILHAVGEGTAVVTAVTRNGDHSDSCKVVVTNGDENFTTGIIADLVVGGSKAIKDIRLAAALAKDGVTFVLQNENVAKIKDGVITAVKEGATKLYAVAQDGSKILIGTINIVKDKISDIIPVTKINLGEAAATLKEGATKVINAIVEPINATNKTLIWKSDDPGIAKVADGVVTAVKAGATKIKAMTPDGNVIAEMIIKVAKAVAKDGWVYQDGGWFYYRMGEAYTGWHWMTVSDGETTPHWSYFGQDGKLRTGWVLLGAGDGESNAHWSYFGPNGWLRTGWQRMGTSANPDNGPEHWSYFGANGWLRTGWLELGSGTSEPDGNKDRHWSYFGPNGWLRTGWQVLGKGTNNPDGNNPAHNSYFGDNGWLRTGTQTIDGKFYVFDGRGWQL